MCNNIYNNNEYWEELILTVAAFTGREPDNMVIACNSLLFFIFCLWLFKLNFNIIR